MTSIIRSALYTLIALAVAGCAAAPGGYTVQIVIRPNLEQMATATPTLPTFITNTPRPSLTASYTATVTPTQANTQTPTPTRLTATHAATDDPTPTREVVTFTPAFTDIPDREFACVITPVNLRNFPDVDAATFIRTLRVGETVIINNDTYVQTNGYWWVQIEDANGVLLGWVVNGFLSAGQRCE